MSSTRQALAGFRPEPLASYLAGLGLVRVLSEQADPSATATWSAHSLIIDTTVPDLAQWLTDAYIPTPVVSPWNGGSGFGVKDKEPVARIAALRRHPSRRLDPLRDALRVADDVVARARQRGWMGDDGVKDKGAVVLELRNHCPDELLPWIDAAIVLAGRDAYFPPLLGTGGNDGRLDFSTNFHQQLLEVMGTTDKERAQTLGWARDLLGGRQEHQLGGAPIGQFDPGNAGGPGSSQFGAASSLANPWSYILCLEGAMVFAASASRRNLHGAGRAAMPFTVTWSPDGSASGAVKEDSRGEVWTPLWSQPFAYPEIRQLFTEARASWRGKPARQAADFYAATRSLGVARGIREFTRYGFQQRNGLAFVAVPLDRVMVREEPSVKLAAEVEDWVARVGNGDAPTAVAASLRAFSSAHLDFVRDGSARGLVRMLAALTTLEMAVGRSSRARDSVQVRKAPSAEQYLPVLLRAESAEFRVAIGLASCTTDPADHGSARTLRQILLPVDRDRWRESPVVPGFGVRPLPALLADVLRWRARTALEDRAAVQFRGIPTFPCGIAVPAADLHRMALGELDDKDLDLAIRACLALTWRNVRHTWNATLPDIPIATLGLLHPLAAGTGKVAGDGEPALALDPGWPGHLIADQVGAVHDQAAARLRRVGWTTVVGQSRVRPGDGTRIAAALVPRCLAPESVLKVIAVKNTPAEELS